MRKFLLAWSIASTLWSAPVLAGAEPSVTVFFSGLVQGNYEPCG